MDLKDLTTQHLQTLSQATELLMRLYLGQIEEVADLYSNLSLSGGDVEVFRQALSDLRPKPNRYGVHCPDIPARGRIAYDLWQVTRNHLAWQRHPEGGAGCDFDRPQQVSDQPLPHVTGTISAIEKPSHPVKLSELAELYQLGQAQIYFEKDVGNDRICDQERSFCDGDVESRHQDNVDHERYSEYLEYDRKAYQEHRSSFVRWIESVDRYSNLLRPYSPTYDPWDDVTVDIGELALNLGKVGLVEWDIPTSPATPIEVINFCYSIDNTVDTPFGMARQAFQRSRWNILKATGLIVPQALSPKNYWVHHISAHIGTDAIDWEQIAHLDIVRGIHRIIDLLPGLKIPKPISRTLQQMAVSVNPDGTERLGGWNKNTFTHRYAIRRGARSLAFHIYGIKGHDDTFDESVVLEHKAFIDWHEQTLATVGEVDLRSIYRLYGIDWVVIQDVIGTLPKVWWVTLGINPSGLLTMKKLKEARNAIIVKAHPDKSGSEDWAKDVNAAYETGKSTLR